MVSVLARVPRAVVQLPARLFHAISPGTVYRGYFDSDDVETKRRRETAAWHRGVDEDAPPIVRETNNSQSLGLTTNHPFEAPFDARTGLKLGRFEVVGGVRNYSDPETSADQVHCAIKGCGKTREDPIHYASE